MNRAAQRLCCRADVSYLWEKRKTPLNTEKHYKVLAKYDMNIKP